MSGQPPKVWVRAHYERFPASVKGAFVLRGMDRDPHQVAIENARLVDASRAAPRPLDIPSALVDVAPHIDFFVPFEFPVTELGPGWYWLECDVEIDGAPAKERPGKPFVVAWPRGSTRRGSVRLATSLSPEGGPKVIVHDIELCADSVRLAFSCENPVDVRIVADGKRLPQVENAFDEETGKGTLVTYPAMKSHEALGIEVNPHGGHKKSTAAIEVKLS